MMVLKRQFILMFYLQKRILLASNQLSFPCVCPRACSSQTAICPALFYTILQKVGGEENAQVTLGDIATQGRALGSSPPAAAAVIAGNNYSLMHTALDQLPYLSTEHDENFCRAHIIPMQ
jgi:hypothetical protein